MNYVETGGYSEELFAVFDSFGNTVALTNTQGNVVVGYLYDLNNGAIKSEYNPEGIDNPYKGDGKERTLSVKPFEPIIIDIPERGTWAIREAFTFVNIKDLGTSAVTDNWSIGGGDEVRPCIGGCPGGTMLCCVGPTEDQVNIECGWLVGKAYDECVSDMYEKWMREGRNCACLPPPCDPVAY